MPELRNVLLIAVAVFLVLVPWFELLSFGAGNEIMVDGIATSAVIVLVIAVGFSLASWLVISWISKGIRLPGIALGVITGAALAVPFLQVLGPVAGVVVGVVAGFVAFLFQKKMADPKENRPLITAVATLAVAYFVLIVVSLVFTPTSIWDDGIVEWYGTAGGLESPVFDAVLYNSINPGLLLVAVSSLIITGLLLRDKK